MATLSDPEIRIDVKPEPAPPREGTVELVWSLRERAWFVRGLSHREWRRLYGHIGAEASDNEILAAAQQMFMDRIPVHVRKLEPTYRLPKD